MREDKISPPCNRRGLTGAGGIRGGKAMRRLQIPLTPFARGDKAVPLPEKSVHDFSHVFPAFNANYDMILGGYRIIRG
jgi:hypothetical protein